MYVAGRRRTASSPSRILIFSPVWLPFGFYASGKGMLSVAIGVHFGFRVLIARKCPDCLLRGCGFLGFNHLKKLGLSTNLLRPILSRRYSKIRLDAVGSSA